RPAPPSSGRAPGANGSPPTRWRRWRGGRGSERGSSATSFGGVGCAAGPARRSGRACFGGTARTSRARRGGGGATGREGAREQVRQLVEERGLAAAPHGALECVVEEDAALERTDHGD